MLSVRLHAANQIAFEGDGQVNVDKFEPERFCWPSLAQARDCGKSASTAGLSGNKFAAYTAAKRAKTVNTTLGEPLQMHGWRRSSKVQSRDYYYVDCYYDRS